METVNFKKLDVDYVKKLTEKQRRWLYKFLIEYNYGMFGDNPLNRTKEQKRSITSARNAYKRDVYNRNKRVSISLENQEPKKEGSTDGRKKTPRNNE